MPRIIESDICIIGSGVTAAMVAEKLAAERDASIVVVEAGDEVKDLADRSARRARYLAYGENPWPNDHLPAQSADGIQSRSMQVGGLAMHWGGVTPRFSPEDFRVRSLYGVGDDWPLDYDDLDPFYQEAEQRMGVAGAQGPPELDPRAAPYPLPPLPLSYNLQLFQKWGAAAGIPFWSQPSAKNSVSYAGRAICCRNDTCSPVCPVGAKYSPDFTWRALRAGERVRLIPRTLVRRLVPAANSASIGEAVAIDRDAPDEPVVFRARTFVVAGGYAWSPHLLLLSASDRFPNGLANSSGLVGRYMAGHRNVNAFVSLPMELYPGINTSHSLVTKKFMRPAAGGRYIRHDLRLWESTYAREPRLRNDDGRVLLGDELMQDWRQRTRTGTARVRAYYDVLPGRDSSLTLDSSKRNEWGDPMPRLEFRDSAASRDLRGWTEGRIESRFRELAAAGGGEILTVGSSDFQDHPAGGCRMGDDPADSVCDSWGRTHDHPNLFVVGAPTCVTAGCANGTLTYVALALKSGAEIAREFPARGA